MSKEENIPIGYASGRSEHNNIIAYLESHRQDRARHIAFRWTQSSIAPTKEVPLLPYEEISYGTFASQIEQVAGGLLNLGIRPGDRVVVFLPIGVELYTAMFAVQRIGAIAVFLDSWARKEQLGICAAKVSPVAIITFPLALSLTRAIPEFNLVRFSIVPGASHAEGSDVTLEELKAAGFSAPVHPVESETTALITFTTGSSGIPKGANRTHRFLSAQHLALAEVIPYEVNDTDLPAFPIFCLNNIASGITTVIPAIDLAKPSPDDGAVLAQQIVQDKIKCATLSPSMFKGLAKHCAKNGLTLKSLRRVVTGGAPISPDDIRQFLSVAPTTTPLVLYGSTEVEPMAEITGSEMLAVPRGKNTQEGVNVGKLHHALSAKFIKIFKGPVEFDSWENIEAPAGTIGELVVSGEHVCRDYYNDPEAFKNSKIKDSKGVVWHRTGDLGRLDDGGNLWIAGRVHNVIYRNNRHYFPVRAEVLLKTIAGVRQAAYLGIPDQELSEKAAVALEADSNQDRPEISFAVKTLFASNDLPLDSLYFIESIPMDPRHHSKVEYESLKRIIQTNNPKDYLCLETK